MMAFDIVDWNVEPNQKFFVKLLDVGTQMRVELFNTLADAQAGTNRVASGTVAFGTDIKVTLTADSTPPSSGDPLTKFNTTLDYHLKATGIDADATKTFALGPFTDLSPIEDPLMLSEQMIQDRGTLEINRATHSSLKRTLRLDSHYSALNEGDIVTVSSTKRGLSAVRCRVDSITIEARIGDDKTVEIFDRLEVVEFKDPVRQ